MKRLLISCFLFGWTTCISRGELYCQVLPASTKEMSDLKFALDCVTEAVFDHVKYPEKKIYIGLTLFKVGKLPTKTVPYTDNGDGMDFAPILFEPKIGKQEVSFKLGPTEGFDHVLTAVWDSRTECDNSQNPNDIPCGRGSLKYVLGRVDDEGLPIPIDAWPRPKCDKQDLSKAGYFKWTGQPFNFDFSGTEASDEIRRLITLNDCWSDTGNIGLGYSVRQWRIAPFPLR